MSVLKWTILEKLVERGQCNIYFFIYYGALFSIFLLGSQVCNGVLEPALREPVMHQRSLVAKKIFHIFVYFVTK